MVLKLNIERFLQIRFSFEKFLSHLFFLFFCAQILSPFIGGRTLYLEFFVALFNPYFLGWVYKQKKSKRFFWILLSFYLMLLFLNIQMFIKMFFMAISLVFLFYAYERKYFYLRPYLIISVLFAVAQFLFLFVDPNLAISIGPTALSQKIWGAYATESLTNFYPIFFIPRVSGLSREAGFFAAFLISILFLLHLESRRNGKSCSFLFLGLLIIGFILSFSKMSLLFLPLLLLERFRKIIDQIPYTLMFILFIGLMVLFWTGHKSYLMNPENESFLHRFGGYALMPSLDISDLIFGINNYTSLDSPLIKALSHMGYDSFAGLSGFIIEKGVLFSILFFLMFWLYGLTTSGLLILLLLTINVQIDTNQNFVVVAYFLCFKFFIGQQYSIFNTRERK